MSTRWAWSARPSGSPEKYGGDAEKAAVAAILHDITKHLSPQEQLNLCEKYGIIPCAVEKSEPKMLHGKTAAAIARTEYGMPEDVCDGDRLPHHRAARHDFAG